MNSLITRIAQLFSSTPQEVVIKSVEDFDELTAYYQINQFDRQLPSTLSLEGLNDRDVLTIGLFDGANNDATEDCIFHTDSMDDWNEFTQHYGGIDKEDPIIIKLCITKRIVNRKCSVYSPDMFIAYLKRLGLIDIISFFDNIFQNGALCLEFQEGNVSLVGSKIAFVRKGEEPVYSPSPLLNENVIEQGKYLCCNDLIKDHLKPTDFELHGTDFEEYPISPFLQKAAILYSLSFLFDYVTLVNGQLNYKLNGYKTLNGSINVDSVYEASIDASSSERYLGIFKWQYNGGNLTDKSAIARNIMSLNMGERNTLFLQEGTLDAIESNYRIYEKENVKQYIEIRNNVSNQLKDYQKYIIGIYDEFEADFKKLFFSFLSFAFTTAIIRVLAKNIDERVLLPDSIILLLIGFCAVSCFYYVYARWRRDKKVALLDKQYNKTRNFYNELLSEKEMNELFTDVKNQDGTYKAFIEERSCHFDWLWLVVNLIFFVILLYIKYIVNMDV